MPRKASEKNCCACLGTTLKLIQLSSRDENKITLLTKLTTCVYEIDWLTTYFICVQCMKLLDISYTFRETCLKSNLSRQNKLKSDIDTNLNNELDERELEPVEVKNDLNQQSEFGTDNLKDEYLNENIYENNSGDDTETEQYNTDAEDRESIDYEPQKRRRRKHLQFSCEKCENTYSSSIKLVDHCIKDHGLKKIDIRPFICDRCPSRFCNSSNLLQHVKYHEAVRSNMCTYCGKGFITKTDLNIHEKQHLNKREYKCKECGKRFNTHKDIRSHKLVVHTDSNSWKYCCEICKKPFPIKSNYDSHMRRHTGDRKFECHLCHRKFIDKCVLQRHMRTHSNVREYKCSYCDREYKDPGVLKVHMAKIHSIGVGLIKIPTKEKKYICHICPKSYYAKNKLTRHLYTHSGEKPYECPVCSKKFNDKSYVKQHLRKTHNIDSMPQENAVVNGNNEIGRDQLFKSEVDCPT